MRTLSDLWIDRSARPTLQDQLARQIRERIRSGDLAPGDPLPSTRDLASELKLSRNTAVYAYERLISEGRNLLHYQASCVAGLPALRENVATYLRDHRGVRCDSHQVVITSGSQQALFLLAMLLLKPRDRVYVEDPGYVEARLAWRSAG